MKITEKLEKQVRETVENYKLCNKKEKVLVALSGGKDSATTAYVLKKLGYNVHGFHINLGLGVYSEKCLEAVKKLCEENDIPLNLYDFKEEMGSSMCYLRTAIQKHNKTPGGSTLKNCAICGVLKKWVINRQARKLKADKIATGHNLDDEAQTFLMNILKGSPGLSSNTGPISQNPAGKKTSKFIPRIKPLFYVLENDIRKYFKKAEVPVHDEPCPCALDSYRIQVRSFLRTLSGTKKRNIINNFDALKDKIKNNSASVGISYCESCGEPARKKLCKKCELLDLN